MKNKMTLEQKIACFEQAAEYFKPKRFLFFKINRRRKDIGFCIFFNEILGVREFNMKAYLYPLWDKYSTTFGIYDFESSNERYDACMKILKELKSQQQ
jgi:hypothetical protein